MTGFGTFALAIPDIPTFTTPTVAEFLWAIGIGLAAAVVGTGIRRLALTLQPIVARRRAALTPLAGLVIGLAAFVFAEGSDRSPSEVLFSGQSALPSLVQNAAGWTVGALLLLIVCKGLAYGVALSAFRGGPTFPGMFIGAAGGIALSHLPGLPMIAGVAMGIGAMTTVMLGLPLTSVLLTAVFLSADAIPLTPLVIVAVVVAYVASARLTPALPSAPQPNPQPTSAAADEPTRRARSPGRGYLAWIMTRAGLRPFLRKAHPEHLAIVPSGAPADGVLCRALGFPSKMMRAETWCRCNASGGSSG